MRVNLRSSLSFPAATIVVLGFTVLPAAVAAQRDVTAGIRIKNFGCVNKEFYRGAQPKAADFADLAALGIRTVIDLQQQGDADEQRLVEAVGMNFYRIGLSDTSWPTAEKADQFLAIVTDPANQPVFIHCHGGRHRAGVMTAIYRMTHDGWTADRAYSEMKQYQFESGFGHGGLKEYVFDFYERIAQRNALVKAN